MKGGGTWLGSMFRRKVKVKGAIVAVPFSVSEYGSSDPPSAAQGYSGVSVDHLPGDYTSVTILNQEAVSVFAGQGEDAACLQSDSGFVFPGASAKVEFHGFVAVGTESNVPERPVARSAFGDRIGECGAYEGEDDNDNTTDASRPHGTMSCDSDHPLSDCASEVTLNGDFTAHTQDLDHGSARYYEAPVTGDYGSNMERDNSYTDLDMASGHVSDPGVYHMKDPESVCSSPLESHGGQGGQEEENNLQKLVRHGAISESGSVGQHDSLSATSGHPLAFCSYENSSVGGDVREISAGVTSRGSPKSESAYHYNADRARSELGGSQSTPVEKRKPWWKVFLVSHRNIHQKALEGRILGSLSEGDVERMSPVNRYGSAVEARSGFGSPVALNEGVSDSGLKENHNGQRLEEGRSPAHIQLPEQKLETPDFPFDGVNFDSDSARVLSSFGSIPQSDLASGHRGLSRVEEWVSSVRPVPPSFEDEQTQTEVEEGPDSPTAPAESFFSDFGGNGVQVSEAANFGGKSLDADDEMAKMVVRSVNPLSTVAHFSGVGLKVIPSLGVFGSLRTLNLSANSFVRISPGCLPRSLHSLDISRNMIVSIEGLRELTRLRVLNLSFNRIARIGNGLSSCTSLREVYLVGNKISEVDGLHRLSKLVVLDLSFNKLTSTKSLGQIAANYKSLQALNLLGNAVQTNLGDEQIRRFVTGICPQLVYLNKQALKSVSTREAAVDNVARAAMGSTKNASKSKRGSVRQSGTSHRGTYSAGGLGNGRGNPGGKGVVTGQDGHHRKTHHSRGHDKLASLKELPKGFAPFPPTASTSNAEQRARIPRRGDVMAIHRVQSEGVMFTENQWLPAVASQGIIQAH